MGTKIYHNWGIPNYVFLGSILWYSHSFGHHPIGSLVEFGYKWDMQKQEIWSINFYIIGYYLNQVLKKMIEFFLKSNSFDIKISKLTYFIFPFQIFFLFLLTKKIL
jgi:hypothetical protein